jgi:hypothetical protein
MTFAADLLKFEKAYQVRVETVLRKVTLDLSAQLIQMSPVDTGRFRNNWYLSVGYGPNTGTNDGADRSGNSALARISSNLGTIKLGQLIWVTNNLPYATRLEYGYSKQAPGGMVRISAARFQQYLSNAVRGVA